MVCEQVIGGLAGESCHFSRVVVYLLTSASAFRQILNVDLKVSFSYLLLISATFQVSTDSCRISQLDICA
jgi:hypothetical protein